MVPISIGSAQIFDFDHVPFSEDALLYRIRVGSLRNGNMYQSKAILPKARTTKKSFLIVYLLFSAEQ